MSKYNTFLAIFIISVIAGIVCLVFYLQGIFNVVSDAHKYNNESPADGFEIMSTLFTPQLLISFVITAAASLAYRIYGIVLVAKNKAVKDGEKAIWIVGFLIMGFIAAIVFLIMAKGRKFTD